MARVFKISREMKKEQTDAFKGDRRKPKVKQIIKREKTGGEGRPAPVCATAGLSAG